MKERHSGNFLRFHSIDTQTQQMKVEEDRNRTGIVLVSHEKLHKGDFVVARGEACQVETIYSTSQKVVIEAQTFDGKRLSVITSVGSFVPTPKIEKISYLVSTFVDQF